MTLKQLEVAKKIYPHLRVAPKELAAQFDTTLERVLRWASQNRSNPDPLLVFTSGPPDEIAANQKALGVDRSGDLCERFLAAVAEKFIEDDVSQLIVAGGETAGAVVTKLGLNLLRIGPEIDPGVPWTLASGPNRKIALALKSGNFGSEDFLVNAWRLLGPSK